MKKKIKDYQSMMDNANSTGEKKLKDLMDELKRTREFYENEKKSLQDEMNKDRQIYNEEKEKLLEKIKQYEKEIGNYKFANIPIQNVTANQIKQYLVKLQKICIIK